MPWHHEKDHLVTVCNTTSESSHDYAMQANWPWLQSPARLTKGRGERPSHASHVCPKLMRKLVFELAMHLLSILGFGFWGDGVLEACPSVVQDSEVESVGRTTYNFD